MKKIFRNVLVVVTTFIISIYVTSWLSNPSSFSFTKTTQEDLANGLKVSIAVPKFGRGDQKSLPSFNSKTSFPVILKNCSTKKQAVWLDKNSWGLSNLSFEFIDKQGNKYEASRFCTSWDSNVCSFWVLEPDDELVVDVSFFPLSQIKWEGLPNLKIGENIFQIRAKYKNAYPPSDYDSWVGTTYSNWDTYSIELVGSFESESNSVNK